jgi:hypothetical protein
MGVQGVPDELVTVDDEEEEEEEEGHGSQSRMVWRYRLGDVDAEALALLGGTGKVSTDTQDTRGEKAEGTGKGSFPARHALLPTLPAPPRQ